MTPELLEAYKTGATGPVNTRVWLRSGAAQYVNPYLPPDPTSYTPLTNVASNPSRIGDDSDYNNSLLMSYSGSSGLFNYLPSIAHGTSIPAYITPMICL